DEQILATVNISCRYPDQFQNHYKYFYKLEDHSVKEIINTGTETRRGRFSISDDKGSRNVSLRIRDVKKDDGGVYSCAAWTTVSSTVDSVGYFSFFSEIQLQSPVQSFLPSTVQSPVQSSSLFSVHSPVQSTSFMLSPLFSKQNFWVYVLISIICLYFFLIYSQVPPVVCVYEEIKPTKHLPDSDTGVYANASTLTPPKDQDLTYSTVSFHKNPGSPTDSSVSVNKEETETEYATVKRPKEPE
uniref:Ig-like domain-containing protein n=1 Tax=Astyanax mexicanus TaxID=7994 RepID=A0A8B9H450_ASTMX